MSSGADSLKEEFIGTRATLLSRLKDVHDNRSWAEFFDLYWKLIRNIAKRSGMNQVDAQEVVQEVFLDLVRKLPEFKYDVKHGSFKKFLKTLVIWRVRDQWDKRSPLSSHEDIDAIDDEDALLVAPNPMDEIWETEWKSNLLDVAKERIRTKIDPRQYQIFDLAISREMPASEISKLLNVSLTKVYLSKHRVLRKVKAELRFLKARFEENLSRSQKESF